MTYHRPLTLCGCGYEFDADSLGIFGCPNCCGDEMTIEHMRTMMEPTDFTNDEAQIAALAEARAEIEDDYIEIGGEDDAPAESPEPSLPAAITPIEVLADLVKNAGVIDGLVAVIVTTDGATHVVSTTMAPMATAYTATVLQAYAQQRVTGQAA